MFGNKENELIILISLLPERYGTSKQMKPLLSLKPRVKERIKKGKK